MERQAAVLTGTLRALLCVTFLWVQLLKKFEVLS